MKTLKVKCPYCQNSILIKIDDNFNIINIYKNNKQIQMSQEQAIKYLKDNGIEFG
ncbi:hypothetical protein ACFHWD_04030 [Clostridium sp. MT-14]|uniref:hypothetical protein n=1 Tax=Clostridium sp. MT-14 TaxID=3348360 RepID=UPI0035F4F58C